MVRGQPGQKKKKKKKSKTLAEKVTKAKKG
jgi:hypothetical protein